MRVVLDTNIYISVLLSPGGQAEKALFRIQEAGHQIILSSAILAELAGVLVQKFHWHEDRALGACRLFSDMAEIVHPPKHLAVLKDEPDNRILEAAVAGHADVIVTGDKHMLRLKKHEGIRIIPLSQFLDIKP